MKVILLILLSTFAMAEVEYFPMRTEIVYGRGTGAGFCRGDAGSSFCIQSIERRAQDDAKRGMDSDCRFKRGQLEPFVSCSGFCSPSMLQPGANEYVNCSANCQGRCEIQE